MPSSPLDALAEATPEAVLAVLRQRPDLVKLGLKGPALETWARARGIDLPEPLYACLPVGPDGVLARVGGDELILECAADEPLLAQLEEELATPTPGVYRLDQQSLSLVLVGELALPVLAQTCGVDMARQPLEQLVYTRVAGASCAVLPHLEQDQRVYRLWIDCTLAPYLWETLAEIVDDLIQAA